MLRPVTTRLTVTDHDRDAAGLTYVYPVVSRRAGGVSVGINLNPNNACNWRCVYCQVPELVKGAAPPIDEDRLEAELRGMLGEARREAWLAQHVADPAHRQLVDVAFSGNGEPTTSHQLDSIVARVLVVAGRPMLLTDQTIEVLDPDSFASTAILYHRSWGAASFY